MAKFYRMNRSLIDFPSQLFEISILVRDKLRREDEVRGGAFSFDVFLLTFL